MRLLKKWERKAYEPSTQEEYEKFWGEYLPKEAKIYEYLLENKEEIQEGTLKELSEKFGVDELTFMGFMDGINTSLKEEYDLLKVEAESDIKINIDFEKLYFNMNVAKADWLYNLPQWNKILTDERRKDITKEYRKSQQIVNENKIGRNDPCTCGSGKKYKKCCGQEK
ncbi:MAG: SEC-C metal-binding domain-containing protein [Filifactoraceae bacterium]